MENSGPDERQQKLANRIRDFNEAVHKWANYDKRAEIHAFCDDMESEVLLTYESEVKRLERMRDEHLEEISKRRAHLLKMLDAPPINDKTIALQNYLNKAMNKYLIPTANVAMSLALPIFLKEKATEKSINFATEKLDYCTKLLQDYSKEIRSMTFDFQSVKFEVNNLFSLRSYGTITYSHWKYRDTIQANKSRLFHS